MTKQEFKHRWESNDNGGGITFDDIAECAKAWGIASTPRIMQIDCVRYMVLKAAGTDDAEEFATDETKTASDLDDEDWIHREAWSLCEYVGECPNCGRERLCLCPNGKHRCEKCNWCPELNAHAPVR